VDSVTDSKLIYTVQAVWRRVQKTVFCDGWGYMSAMKIRTLIFGKWYSVIDVVINMMT